MTSTLANGAARVLIVDESGAGRQLLSDVIRSLGFNELIVVASGKDAVSVLEVESVDWLVTSSLRQQPVTALQLLKLLSREPSLRHVRTSLIYDPDDEPHLDWAFALGLMSCHPRSAIRDEVANELRRLLGIAKESGWRPVLTAAEYLRGRLRWKKAFGTLVNLEKSLLDLHPGSSAVLLKLGEAHLQAGEVDAGIGVLRQAAIIDERAKAEGQNIMQRILNTQIMTSSPGAEGNVLGLGCSVIVDSDTAVLGAVHSLLVSVGAPHVECFDDGRAAWRWLEKNDEPSLILQEWRLPGLAGPLLLQRVRQRGFVNVPIIVTSSVIKPNELPLLRELGVDNVVPKPFGQQLFFKNVIWTIQQCRAPTEQKSLERKIRRLLDQDQVTEAERLRRAYMADRRFPTAGRKHIEAEFALHAGSYRLARDLAIEALKLTGDSILLLGLIGKCLLKLGDFTAAHKFFEKANALSPLNIEHLCNMAVSRFEAGQRDEAQFLLGKARAIDAENHQVQELACQHAIIEGDAERAKGLFGELESAKRIVGYMNNRAVALTRSGRYEDGIKLYIETLRSLPGEWSEIHDTVAYNLGLAYARYGELDKAQLELKRILDRPSAPLAKRAHSLAHRIKQAASEGIPLPLYTADESESKTGEPSEGQAGTRADHAAVLEIRRGDLCLYGVYEAPDDPAIQKMLEAQTHFKSRTTAAQGSSLQSG